MSKIHNFWYLIPLNPRIKIFFKIPAMSLFYFIDPKLHAKIQEKLMSSLSRRTCKVSGKTNERSLKTDIQMDGPCTRVITMYPFWQGWGKKKYGQKSQKYPENRFFFHLWPTKDLCSKVGLSDIHTIMMQKVWKN